ncbi:MAG TPA: SusD/RagB family nutrient-binding outer membrane lipoprotein [Bacteroidia bacterium]|jgi:hypothetical protein|nr:SusD/RagB family nutrient-binding outer membrane lipoprotein [Bacteroidia bacterium]
MKTIKQIVQVGLMLLLLSPAVSCKKYLSDVEVNPNKPEGATSALLLSTVEVGTFDNYTGSCSRRCAVLTQHCTGVLFYYLSINNYSILEADVQKDWNNLYSGTMMNAQVLADTYGNACPYYRGMAKVLKAMNLGLTTDMWGDVPNRQAFQGNVNKTPVFDPQQLVLSDIQTMLNEAISDLKRPSSSNLTLPGNDDFIYTGQIQSWIAAAWVLKARYANHLSKRSSSQSALDAISYLDSAYANGFTSSAADMTTKFGAGTTEINQWQSFQNQWGGYVKMGKNLVDIMVANADPRLPFYSDTVAGGTYAGAPPDNPAATASNIGAYPTQIHLPLVSYVEAKFIEAECQLRLGHINEAAAAHNLAVKASILNITGATSPVYEAAHASETAGSITLAKIMTEKYVASFTQVESWSDWRRTDLPALVTNPKGVVSGIPRILPTPRDERLYNPGVHLVENVLTHVWWDL